MRTQLYFIFFLISFFSFAQEDNAALRLFVDEFTHNDFELIDVSENEKYALVSTVDEESMPEYKIIDIDYNKPILKSNFYELLKFVFSQSQEVEDYTKLYLSNAVQKNNSAIIAEKQVIDSILMKNMDSITYKKLSYKEKKKKFIDEIFSPLISLSAHSYARFRNFIVNNAPVLYDVIGGLFEFDSKMANSGNQKQLLPKIEQKYGVSILTMFENLLFEHHKEYEEADSKTIKQRPMALMEREVKPLDPEYMNFFNFLEKMIKSILFQ